MGSFQKNSIEKKIKKISIRGRLAFGAKCIEKYLYETKIRHELLVRTLDVIWEFTSSKELDKWDEKINDFMPDNILDDHPDNRPEEYRFLKGNEYFVLKELYHNVPKDLIDLIQLTIEIGIGNLYGGTGDHSEITLDSTLKVYEIASRSLENIPDINKFIISPFIEFHGWGNSIGRHKFKE